MSWEKAVESFIEDWDKENVEGFLVCGSYVTGSPSKRSDIDLHIVLSPSIDWRQRGSRIIDGYLIEYFVNPPAQIEAYFKEDFESNRKHTAHMFSTGKILMDKHGVLASLREKAEGWMKKEYPEMSEMSVELSKYALWDLTDNLQDLYDSGSESFSYAYWSSLINAFEFYSRYLRHDVIPIHKISEQLNDSSVQTKYSIAEYPDESFKNLMNQAIKAKEREEKYRCFIEITEYIQDKTGGFALDGWSIRTPLSY